VAQQALPLLPPVPDAFVFGLLVAARDAARVALGRLHVGSAAIEATLLGSVDALGRSAVRVFAVRRHRSSIRLSLRSVPRTT
jgi:hypothetical protein